MAKLTLPDGKEIELYDLGARQMLVPAGATIIVPPTHEWTITAMAVPPVRDYVPPIGSETRDFQSWGDVQIRIDDVPNTHLRASALTLMDYYWGRHNLSPALPDLVVGLQRAQHALATAPKIPELLVAIERTTIALHEYLAKAAPTLPAPVTVTGNRRITIEHIDCEGAAGHHLARPLDVELLMWLKRPVS